jgi:hypothetical protein
MVTVHVRDVPAGNMMMPEMTTVNAVIPKTTIIINKGFKRKHFHFNRRPTSHSSGRRDSVPFMVLCSGLLV